MDMSGIFHRARSLGSGGAKLLAGWKEKVKNLLILMKEAMAKPKSGGPDFRGTSQAEDEGRKRRSSRLKKSSPAGLFIQKIDALSDRLLGHFPKKNRRPILLGLGAMTGVFIILLIGALLLNLGKTKQSAGPAMAAGPFIPPEELFLPEEPDFLPDYLLEREKRSSWSLEDIRLYWQKPENSELWREEVKSSVDKLMEGVR